MATDTNPLSKELNPEDRRRLFSEIDYTNMNGVRREVTITSGGAPVQVEHGLGFRPDADKLTVRVHTAFADIGTLYMPREPDDKYVYVTAPRPGRAFIEITHPPRGAGV